MILSKETEEFIREHRLQDVRQLALQAARYPLVEMGAALTQIAGWQAAREKLPSWAAVEGIIYPPRLSMEQCSSEATARYKGRLVTQIAPCGTLTDLTGGFGIDCAFLAPNFTQVTYVERQEVLCQAARHNFPLLGLRHIDVRHMDSTDYLQEMPENDWIFIDPARRDLHGGKTVAITDCEPDVSRLEELLLQKAAHVLVKLSPMLDLSLAISELRHVQEVHVVALNNECKELLLVLGREGGSAPEEIPFHCINLGQHPSSFRFCRREEQAAPCPIATQLGTYLYEPNVTLLKAGAFRSLTNIYKVEKLHANSHLYTSDRLLPEFPGRCFRITGHSGFGKKELKALTAGIKRANLTVRNFPMSVADLRKRLKIAEGGDHHLFATTLADDSHVIIQAERLTSI
ncbi:MAG: SAM-dependent methyltransferase [Bacteroides sp.]|nr:SAM-dependent methyltransferase [Bacteroides sp.]